MLDSTPFPLAASHPWAFWSSQEKAAAGPAYACRPGWAASHPGPATWLRPHPLCSPHPPHSHRPTSPQTLRPLPAAHSQALCTSPHVPSCAQSHKLQLFIRMHVCSPTQLFTSLPLTPFLPREEQGCSRSPESTILPVGLPVPFLSQHTVVLL